MNVFSFNAHGLDVNLKSVNIGNTAGGECFSLLLERAKTRPNGTASTPHPPENYGGSSGCLPNTLPLFYLPFPDFFREKGKDYFPSSGQDSPVIKFWRKHKEVTMLVKLHCVWASWELVKWGPLSRTGPGICILTSLQKRKALWSEDHHLSSTPLKDLWQGFLSLVLMREGKHKGKLLAFLLPLG